MRTYTPSFKQCPIAINGEKLEKIKSNTRLGLKNLTGAFVILGIGYCLSLLVFLCELVFTKRSNKAKHRSGNKTASAQN